MSNDGAMFQDAAGKSMGPMKGTHTVFLSCEVTIDYDNVSMYEHDSVHSNIMTEAGFKLPNESDIRVDFEFTQNVHYKWPTVVSWRGPAAVLEFVEQFNGVVSSKTLPSSLLEMTEINIQAKKKEFDTMHIRVSEGCATCAVAFSYIRPKQVKKLESLGADLEADEEHKDITIHCAGGETVKVHKLLLQVYSRTFAGRFNEPRWNAEVMEQGDSKGAWELIVSSLYGHDDADFNSPHMGEALQIANRHEFKKFASRGWGRAMKAIDEESVLQLLALSWPMLESNSDAKDCVDKCLEFFVPKMASMGAKWFMAYAAFLQDNADFSDYVAGFETEKKGRKRSRSPKA